MAHRRLLNVQIRDLHVEDRIVAGLNTAEVPTVMEPGVWPHHSCDGWYNVAVRWAKNRGLLTLKAADRVDIDRPNLTIHGL